MVAAGSNWHKVKLDLTKALRKKQRSAGRRPATTPIALSRGAAAAAPQAKAASGAAVEHDEVRAKIVAAQGANRPAGVQQGGADLTSVLAIDCEMVGIGPAGKRDALARVSIVNFNGDVVLDSLVKPTEPITDYRTPFSGIARGQLAKAPSFQGVQAQVAAIIDKRILVGHSIKSDLHALLLSHPRQLTRDTARNKELCPIGPKALKKLCLERLDLRVQDGAHDSVEDARAVLALYKSCSNRWEKRVAQTHRAQRKLKAKKGEPAR